MSNLRRSGPSGKPGRLVRVSHHRESFYGRDGDDTTLGEVDRGLRKEAAVEGEIIFPLADFTAGLLEICRITVRCQARRKSQQVIPAYKAQIERTAIFLLCN
jgi:hypothetical protein